MRRDRDGKPRGKIFIYGKHALYEALSSAPHVVNKAFLAPEVNDPELKNLLRKNGVQIGELKAKEANQMVGHDASHQGVVAAVNPQALLVDFDEFISKLEINKSTMLVLLDELTDPHNVGAIIRSAAAFGASGVLIPARNQAPITGAVVKSSAGMAFRVPLVSIGNVNTTIEKLKQKGFWSYALAMEGANDSSAEKFDVPALFIVGNEGKGIREKTLEHSDIKLSIPMDPRCESLNASVSIAVVLYEWAMQHRDILKGDGK